MASVERAAIAEDVKGQEVPCVRHQKAGCGSGLWELGLEVLGLGFQPWNFLLSTSAHGSGSVVSVPAGTVSQSEL